MCISESLVQAVLEVREHLPVERVAVPSYLLCEEAFPKRQREPSLSQLRAVPRGPVAVPREQSSALASPLPS